MPPPLVALVLCVLMWGVMRLMPLAQIQSGGRNLLALLLICVAIGFSSSGVLAFRSARTTVDPRYPHKASQLVDGGVYRFSRNPMYVGLLCALGAWAVYLGNPYNLLALPFYVWFITRFQIKPEETALRTLFGEAFEAYCARVRRWL